jgi:hypothetical protein
MSGIIGDPGAKSGIIGLQTPVSLPYFWGRQSSNHNSASVGNWEADTITFDTTSAWDSTNHRYNPKIKGLYFVSISSNFTGGTFPEGYFRVEKNNTQKAFAYKNSTDNYHMASVSVILELNGTTDYINFKVVGFIDAGADWNRAIIYLIK